MPSDSAVAQNIAQARIAILKINQFDHLEFEGVHVPGARSLDESNVKRLLHRFENEGCRRLDPATWIPCELSQQQLGRIISNDGAISSLSQNPPPEAALPDDVRLLCFQGQHRIAAASRMFARQDTWWVFEIYDPAILTLDGRQRLREGEYIPQEYNDGEIYRNVRLCQKRGDEQEARKWLAKWSSAKCDEFNQLHKPERKDFHQQFRNRLEDLLLFPGVWGSWKMGSHLLSWQVPDELADYLSHICQGLLYLTDNRPEILDSYTMSLLEGRYPAISLTDRLYLESIFHEVFPLVDDPNQRAELRRRVLGFSHMIPSLKLFFEDTKYLKPIMQLLRSAFCRPKFRGSVRESLRRRYVEPADKNFPIQISANEYVQQTDDRSDYGFWSAYRQLCLFLMRNFFGMSNCLPLAVHKYRGSRKQPDTHELWKQFSQLSENLGFGSPSCPYRNTKDNRAHEYLAIYSLLKSLRPPDAFDYEDTVLINMSTRAWDTLKTMRPKPTRASTPSMVTDSPSGFSIGNRCGMTDIESFFSDQKYLYLQNIYKYDYESGPYLTSFAAKRNMFLSFFGVGPDANTPVNDVIMEATAEPLSNCQDHSQPGVEIVLQTDQPQTSATEHQAGLLGTHITGKPVAGPSSEANALVLASQAATKPIVSSSTEGGALILSSQANFTPMEIVPLVEITTNDPMYCICDVKVEPDTFVAYFKRSTQREGNLYYLWDLSKKELVCAEDENLLAQFRDNSAVLASLDINLELRTETALNGWKRGMLYILFPPGPFSTHMFTQSTISDPVFDRMCLPRKNHSTQWRIVTEFEDDL